MLKPTVTVNEWFEGLKGVVGEAMDDLDNGSPIVFCSPITYTYPFFEIALMSTTLADSAIYYITSRVERYLAGTRGTYHGFVVSNQTANRTTLKIKVSYISNNVDYRLVRYI